MEHKQARFLSSWISHVVQEVNSFTKSCFRRSSKNSDWFFQLTRISLDTVNNEPLNGAVPLELQTVQAKPPEKGRDFSTPPSACAGQSSHQLRQTWALGQIRSSLRSNEKDDNVCGHLCSDTRRSALVEGTEAVITASR